MTTVKIFIVGGDEELKLERATKGSAAFDIKASHDFVINPEEAVLVNTGLIVDMPEGMFALMLPRSGFSSKYGVRMSNSVGLIDNDYKMEWKVPLYRDAVLRNSQFLDDQEALKEMVIKKGTRIAQVLFMPPQDIEIEYVSKFTLENKEHHGSGFGSTGL